MDTKTQHEYENQICDLLYALNYDFFLKLNQYKSMADTKFHANALTLTQLFSIAEEAVIVRVDPSPYPRNEINVIQMLKLCYYRINNCGAESRIDEAHAAIDGLLCVSMTDYALDRRFSLATDGKDDQVVFDCIPKSRKPTTLLDLSEQLKPDDKNYI